MDEKTVMLSGLPLTCNPVKMKLRFESECKVRIVRIKVGSTHTEVTLPSKKDCETFCNNLPPKITFGKEEHELKILDGTPLSVEPETEPVPPKSAAKNSFATPQSWSSLNKLPCCECGLLVQPTSKGITPEELKEYFEADTPSCGGPIETVIPMIEGILIIFNEDDVAQRVWNHRPHRINKKPVVVFLKTVPPKYPQKLIVKPHEPTLNKEKFRLLLDQLSKDGRLAKIQTTMKGAFFTTFDDTVGETVVQNIVDNFHRSNPAIDISFLHKTDCLIVESSPPLDMSDHEIKTFFENSAWSGGGSVTRIDHVENGHLLIYFTSYKDAGAVCDKSKKRELSVFGSTLKIHQYFHNVHERKLEKPNQLDDLIAPWLDDKVDLARNAVTFENLDPDLAKFFHAKQEHVKILMHHLKGQADIKTSPKGFYISFKLEKDGDRQTVLNQIDKLLEDYSAEKIFVNGEAMRQLVEKAFSNKSSKEDVCVWWSESEKETIVITGLKSEVASYVKLLRTFHLNLDKDNFRWLVETKMLEQLRKDHKAIVGCSGSDILILHDEEQFDEAKQAIETLISRLKREKFEAEERDFILFLSAAQANGKITENVTGIFQKNNIPAILIVNSGEVSILGLSDCLEKANSLLNNALAVGKSFCKRTAGPNQPELVTAWKRVYCFEAEGRLKTIAKESSVSFIGFREFVTSARHVLAQFEESFKTVIAIEQGAIQHLMGYKQEFISLCETCKVRHEVSHLGMVLTGEKTNVDSVSEVLETFVKDIVKETAHIKHPKAAGFLSSNDGTNLLSKVGKATSSTVIMRPRSPFQSDIPDSSNQAINIAYTASKRIAPPTSMLIQPLAVSLRKGNITAEVNDVIVNSVGTRFNMLSGKISKSILDEGGLSIQSELSDLQHNYMRVTSGGNLNCKKIIHVVLPNAIPLMKEFLVESLHKAEELKAHSISIPPIGTGYSQDYHSIAQMMFQSLQDFVKKPESIKNLRVVDIVLFNDIQLKDFREEFSVMLQASPKEESHSGNIFGSLLSRASQPFSALKNLLSFEDDPKPQALDHPRPQAFGNPNSGRNEEAKSKRFGQLTVSVRQGDITNEGSYAIVNSTNCKFDLSQGMVSSRIISKGGSSIQAEVLSAKGKAIRVTSGGSLKCKKIIHVDTPRDVQKIGLCIGDILEHADCYCCSSISIPAIGTGKLQLSEKEVARIMLKAVQKFEQSHPKLKSLAKVDFVIYDGNQMRNFRDAFFGDHEAYAEGWTMVKGVGPTVEAYSYEKDRAKEALKKVEEALEEKFGYLLDADIVGKSTPVNEQYLQECGRRHQVEITRFGDYYLIKGKKENSSAARCEIQDMAKKEFKQLSTKVPIWEYEEMPSRWVQFSLPECEELGMLYEKYKKDRNLSTVFITFQKEQASIDFKTMKLAEKRNIRLEGASNTARQKSRQNPSK